MSFFKKENKRDHWLMNISLLNSVAWLLIVFVIRKVFIYFQLNLFLLGVLPNFFASVSIYLFLMANKLSKFKAALLTFTLLFVAEIIQLYTPRTFDPLDLSASVIGISVAELIRRIVERILPPPQVKMKE